ncbi:MAG: glycosyltransferase family 39 protein, partial [Candidatus Eremiobacteraeota bacterium]|nr:glycosyltransferase family 39 protein [Candidatus Eremiobacteraeota bacterium]
MALVLALAGALRLYDLSTVPTELIADELEFYNSAVSFVTTGHDLDGERHIFLASHNPGRNPPIYAFSELPFTMLLGPSPVSQRLAAVVYGLLVVVLLFFLVRQMTQRDDVALLAALFAAVAPIFVHFSRIAWQPACEVPFLLAGLYGLARGLGIGETDHGKAPLRRNWLIAGAVLLGLTAYTYMAGWFYALVLGGALLALEALFAPSAQHRRAAILAYGLALLVA